tara:strand:+ start:12399 stop:13490 length:1092 start_codon:yes stop_codon:yes gene_type:complete
MSNKPTLLIMAGGTGGHIFPALAVFRELEQSGWHGHWFGTQLGLEAKIIPKEGIAISYLDVKGVRGKSLMRRLAFPFVLFNAVMQARTLIMRIKPDVVLGMGGYASGPGGLAAKMLGIPLIIHEQNATAGLTNKVLSKIATVVLQAFPGAFHNKDFMVTGNPVRAEFVALPAPENRYEEREGKLRVLVVGGSQGAASLNATVADWYCGLAPQQRPELWHQAGARNLDEVSARYQQGGIDNEQIKLADFIDDMAKAYAWADVVICRAGALTVAEVAAAGVASIFVPFPAAVDDHQTKNAQHMVDGRAALMCAQSDFNTQFLQHTIGEATREMWKKMAINARKLAAPEATQQIAEIISQQWKGAA